MLAKGVTAGYTPMGVVMVAEAAAEALAASGGFMAGFTYFANPLSCAIGAAVLDELMGVHTGRDLIANAGAMGARMRARQVPQGSHPRARTAWRQSRRRSRWKVSAWRIGLRR